MKVVNTDPKTVVDVTNVRYFIDPDDELVAIARVDGDYLFHAFYLTDKPFEMSVPSNEKAEDIARYLVDELGYRPVFAGTTLSVEFGDGAI